MKFLKVFLNVFRIRDLRRRLVLTLGLLAAYRLGSYLPVPGINVANWQQFFQRNQDTWGFFDLFAGGNIRQFSVFALGVMPYITASILLQVFTVMCPALEKLQNEGALGRHKITQWTRYLTVVLAAIQAVVAVALLPGVPENPVISPGFGSMLLATVSLTAGTVLLMWMGEQITAHGVGNGMSLIIFAGIVVSIGNAVTEIYSKIFILREWGLLTLTGTLFLMTAVTALVVLVERAERRVQVQYAKRTGQVIHLPLKVNPGGVMPVIFASSLLASANSLAAAMAKYSPATSALLDSLRRGEPLYYLLFTATILFFSFFYVSIILNPNEVADHMRGSGASIPGIRPGRRTAEHLDAILTRTTLAGSIYLAILSMLPDFILTGIKLQHLPRIGNWIDRVAPRLLLEGWNVHFSFGGTSLLIAVGVAMDLVNQIEARLIMRHYETFRPPFGRMRRLRRVQ